MEIDQAQKIYLGEWIHRTMEWIYRPFEGKMLSKSIIEKIYAQLDQKAEKVSQSFRKNGIPGEKIIAQVGKECVKHLLKEDMHHAPFSIVALEHGKKEPFLINFKVNNAHQIALGGIIDRIDKKSGILRIIDYKSGNPAFHITSMEEVMHPSPNHRVPRQLLFYSFLFSQKYPETSIILPTLMGTSLGRKKEGTTPLYYGKGVDKKIMHNFKDYESNFEKILKKLLESIWDPKIPFKASDQVHFSPYPSFCPHGQ